VKGGYADAGNAELIELPYSGDETSMVLIVPKAGAFSTWESQLTAASLTTALSGLKNAALNLSMPKFKIKGATISLAARLQALGMKEAFSSTADFSAMSDARLSVSDVLHQAFVDVSEKGTEAAAATAVIINETSVPIEQTVKVDRPFFVAIRDRVTGGILFVGRIVDPT
jgi:serpin B